MKIKVSRICKFLENTIYYEKFNLYLILLINSTKKSMKLVFNKYMYQLKKTQYGFRIINVCITIVFDTD